MTIYFCLTSLPTASVPYTYTRPKKSAIRTPNTKTTTPTYFLLCTRNTSRTGTPDPRQELVFLVVICLSLSLPVASDNPAPQPVSRRLMYLFVLQLFGRAACIYAPRRKECFLLFSDCSSGYAWELKMQSGLFVNESSFGWV
ncbi:hypothetical protein BaRGS_00021156 [Batillaria attramentaria]|uniref:Uncharacterized protein n=1 Tax=Batillaria attramentaria TaxID=370345 RepID=A0ABD0KKI3_9CAEN